MYRRLFRGMKRPTASSVVVAVLVASVAVTAVLAWHALEAARRRREASASVTKQFAGLAAWEFSRAARREIDAALMHATASHVHRERNVTEAQCDCATLRLDGPWFEVMPGGTLSGRGAGLDAALEATLTAIVRVQAEEQSGVRILALSESDPRIVALRWEPHLGTSGRQLGVVLTPAALRPALERTYQRAVLLPPLLSASADPRNHVALSIHDRDGEPVFQSGEAANADNAVRLDVLPAAPGALRVGASMTPAFVASLGPAHGAGPSPAMLIGLVAVNAMLALIGLWQLHRERSLARLRANFVAGVSHELRTPLAQIRLFADTLLLERVRNPHEARRALEIIGQETRRLGQLVENILFFHGHARGRVVPGLAPVDLALLIPDIVDGFTALAVSKRARVGISVLASPVVVQGDADALRQVILNLLDNAVKFGPPEQTVSIVLDTQDDRAIVAIDDQGPGVAPRDRRRIFRAFERGDHAGTGGVGIGLAIVAQILEAHGAEIDVSSSPSGGARFVVALPIVRPAGAPAAATSLAGRSAGQA